MYGLQGVVYGKFGIERNRLGAVLGTVVVHGVEILLQLAVMEQLLHFAAALQLCPGQLGDGAGAAVFHVLLQGQRVLAVFVHCLLQLPLELLPVLLPADTDAAQELSVLLFKLIQLDG